MKINRIAWVLLAGLLSLTSCSDDDNEIEIPTLNIVSSEVNFTAVGGTGVIKTDTPSGLVSAKSSEDWCQVKLTDPNTVTLTIPNYEALPTRNAIVSLEDGAGHQKNISVTQTGLVLMLDENRIRTIDDESTTIVTCSHSSKVTFSADVPWLSATIEGNNIRVKCESNTTGDMRMGYLYTYSANQKDSIRVIQGEMKDILGDYYLSGQRTEDSQQVYLTVKLQKYGTDQVAISVPSYNWRIVTDYDNDNMSIRLKAGSRLGYMRENNKIVYIFLNLWDTEAGYYTWKTNYSTDFVFLPREGGGTIGYLSDNGSWYPCLPNALRFDKYSTTTATTGSDGLFLALKDPFLRKVRDDDNI